MGSAASGNTTNVEDRRANERRSAKVSARVAASPELRLPRAEAVDISQGGLLLAFDEPVGFPVGHRLVISLDLPDGNFHSLGRVTRAERGDDFRTYVAMQFVNLREADFADLRAQLDKLDEHRGGPEPEADSG